LSAIQPPIGHWWPTHGCAQWPELRASHTVCIRHGSTLVCLILRLESGRDYTCGRTSRPGS